VQGYPLLLTEAKLIRRGRTEPPRLALSRYDSSPDIRELAAQIKVSNYPEI
jgi:hypothetical protein